MDELFFERLTKPKNEIEKNDNFHTYKTKKTQWDRI